ncbi:MAG: ArsI/CadI family heavy metal resistance metalloenzyme [Candidatus Binatia bacterium]
MAQNTFHVALTVKDLLTATAQYKKIFGVEPAKVKPDYVKFELSDPPVILSLNPGPGEPGTVSHLGIRYTDSEKVLAEQARTKAQGIAVREQVGTTCCYAKADKFWVHDADGMEWEMYTLLEDADIHSTPENACCTSASDAQTGQQQTTTAGCCTPTAKAPVDAPLIQIHTKRSCC